ncbi:ATP-binding cassette domain-containing protein [Acetobacterium paludosum]|uniref:ATP-binding cassette domain-containing protein n=1 Tax=Acetobacterium paludosum TaxID=52693 RepID=A0A923KW08_9FIRM|nr:ABC transporter ATP-binding protein [Acetobacterium paludosum]MBC3887553.1 ATP-binding cassette domain-containing protein [Acetobacterium paludosum]
MENKREILSVKDLNKSYDAFKLKNVSLTLQAGSIMGFIGRNGAGKTTTLKSMVNLVHSDTGSVEFFGMDIKTHESEIKQRISFAFGGVDYYLQKKLGTITNVYKRFYDQWDEKAYEDYLKQFELNSDKNVKELSQGMRVKYGLALALSHHAEILILDEPTSGLDPVSRDEILNIFTDVVDSKQASILFSTHITSDLDKCADEITYIKNGEILVSEEKDSFVDSYRLVEGSMDQLTEALKSIIIGCHERRGEFSGLIKSKDCENAQDIKCSPADLESIMIHIERRA